jgi:hypothetical protein
MPTWLFLGLSMVVIGPLLGVFAQALLRSSHPAATANCGISAPASPDQKPARGGASALISRSCCAPPRARSPNFET